MSSVQSLMSQSKGYFVVTQNVAGNAGVLYTYTPSSKIMDPVGNTSVTVLATNTVLKDMGKTVRNATIPGVFRKVRQVNATAVTENLYIRLPAIGSSGPSSAFAYVANLGEL